MIKRHSVTAMMNGSGMLSISPETLYQVIGKSIYFHLIEPPTIS